MFKSIEYIRYDEGTKSYIYNLIDTEFKCEVVARSADKDALAALIIISEYKKRNYSYKQIVKNLFVCNLHLCNKHGYIFEKLLGYQLKYADKSFKDIDFSKLYYESVKNMWDKHKAFI